MSERLLIKHAVGGRTFLDSAKQELAYELEPLEGGRWKIAVSVPKTDTIDELLRLKEELNVFLFVKRAGEPEQKNWFYTGDGNVTYDEQAHRLTILAQSRLTYYPSDYVL
jgi:hypothetical protein